MFISVMDSRLSVCQRHSVFFDQQAQPTQTPEKHITLDENHKLFLI